MKNTRRLTVAVAALVILAVVATMQAGAAPQNVRWTATLGAAPALAPAAPPPLETCSLNGATRTCELWAMAGTLALPDGASVPIWGFSDSAAGPAQLPGPTLVANSGETLVLILHNELAGETVSLAIPNVDGMLPDLDGVPAGGAKTYNVNLTQPGTYLYEAGMTQNGTKQVAMGLYGVLIVRPAGQPGQAYADASTAFDVEALAVLSEIDPVFSANPAAVSLENWKPRYWLLNGKAFPETATIDAAAGQRVLLRYVNTGIRHHSMGLLGMSQQILGSDAVPLTYHRKSVAETVWPGQGVESRVTVPVGAPEGTRYLFYDTSLSLNNNGAKIATNGPTAFGGMMTFVNVTTGGGPVDPGPGVTAASFTPTRTNGVDGATFAATLSEVNTGGDNIVAVEYFVDTLGAEGTGTPVTNYAPGVTVDVEVFFDAATLAGWTSGTHTVFVRGKDHDTWGPAGSALLNLDKMGPESKGLSLSPNPSNGSSDVAVTGTGDETNTGGGTVMAAEYALDGGTALPMTLNKPGATITSLTAIIPQATVAGLTEGVHTITVRSQDDLGNWTDPATAVDLALDMSGPDATGVTVTPSTLNFTPTPGVTTVKLEGTVTDPPIAGAQSIIATAEGFIGTLGEPGTGFPMFATDGMWDESQEAVYYNIPVGNFSTMSQGQHPLYIRGKDAVGNWGDAVATNITIERGVANDTTGPKVTALTVSPNPASGATTVVLSGTASDANYVSHVSEARWSRNSNMSGSAPVLAKDGVFDSTVEAITASINVTGWRGRVAIYVQARDVAGNWGPVSSVLLRVSR